MGEISAVHDSSDATGWSAGATGAIIKGNYKAINEGPPGMGMAAAPWRLYDLAIDPGEINDISAAHPELTDELVEIWERDWR